MFVFDIWREYEALHTLLQVNILYLHNHIITTASSRPSCLQVAHAKLARYSNSDTEWLTLAKPPRGTLGVIETTEVRSHDRPTLNVSDEMRVYWSDELRYETGQGQIIQ